MRTERRRGFGRARGWTDDVVVAVVALVLAGPAALVAQEQQPEQKGGWEGTVDLGLTLTGGASRTTSLSFSAGTVYESEDDTWSFRGSYLRATADGEEKADRGDLSVRYHFYPDDRFYLTAKAVGSFNEPKGLDLRVKPAFGLGVEAVESDRVGLSFESGGSWIRDHFVDGTSDEALYVSAAQSLKLRISETTDLEQSLTYNPRTSDVQDYLLRSEASLRTEITDAVGLKVRFLDEFESEPFVDPASGEPRPSHDLTLTTETTLSF